MVESEMHKLESNLGTFLNFPNVPVQSIKFQVRRLKRSGRNCKEKVLFNNLWQ